MYYETMALNITYHAIITTVLYFTKSVFKFIELDNVGKSVAILKLIVCAADVKILEMRINHSLWRTKRWLDSRCLKRPRLCWSQTGDPSNTRGSFSGNMKSSGKRALSTWMCSWIEGLASANTCRSRLPKPSNVGPP